MDSSTAAGPTRGRVVRAATPARPAAPRPRPGASAPPSASAPRPSWSAWRPPGCAEYPARQPAGGARGSAGKELNHQPHSTHTGTYGHKRTHAISTPLSPLTPPPIRIPPCPSSSPPPSRTSTACSLPHGTGPPGLQNTVTADRHCCCCCCSSASSVVGAASPAGSSAWPSASRSGGMPGGATQINTMACEGACTWPMGGGGVR